MFFFLMLPFLIWVTKTKFTFFRRGNFLTLSKKLAFSPYRALIRGPRSYYICKFRAILRTRILYLDASIVRATGCICTRQGC